MGGDAFEQEFDDNEAIQSHEVEKKWLDTLGYGSEEDDSEGDE